MTAAHPPIPGWDHEQLARSKDVVCILDSHLRIRWTNGAWGEFAKQNGLPGEFLAEWSEGADYTAAIQEPLRFFYEQHLRDCLARDNSWSHDYDCSSPGSFRRFHQVVYPVQADWVIITNSLVVEREHGGRWLPVSAIAMNTACSSSVCTAAACETQSSRGGIGCRTTSATCRRRRATRCVVRVTTSTTRCPSQAVTAVVRRATSVAFRCC